jgi:hypothetical protein
MVVRKDLRVIIVDERSYQWIVEGVIDDMEDVPMQIYEQVENRKSDDEDFDPKPFSDLPVVNGLHCAIDGDSLMITGPGFVDLQESEAVFVKLRLGDVTAIRKLVGVQ